MSAQFRLIHGKHRLAVALKSEKVSRETLCAEENETLDGNKANPDWLGGG